MNKRHFLIILYYTGLLWNAISCKEPYTPPAVKNSPDFLVVEGLLTSYPDTASITLTRTRNIADSTPAPPELNASVMVEGETSGAIPLFEKGNGVYSNLLSMDSSEKYRLLIQTAEGRKYESDFIPFKITPEIDSLGWKEDSSHVFILVNSHDPANNTRYYRWTYEETWKYHTYFLSDFDYANDSVLVRGADHLIYYCWTSLKSSDIQVGTSAGLSQDMITGINFHSVSKHSEKIYIEYSIMAKQYALTRDQFEFWTNLKKTTEQLGTLFDAQPSQLTGNIHCISDPAEIALGYICASTITKKRMFIKRFDLSSYAYIPYFLECQISPEIVQSLSPGDRQKVYEYLEAPNHPFTFLYESNGGYFIAPNFCADCREHGGTTTKPAYWP
jgi:Domain of unknown function (DUF4249)